MAGSGKHSFDSGRARHNRYRDRAQLDFDDLLIDDFLNGELDPRDAALDMIPVRYGGRKLATHLSDSAIANAMLDAGVFEPDDDGMMPIRTEIGTALFELVDNEAKAEPVNAGMESTEHVAEAPPVIRPLRVMVTRPIRPARQDGFSARRFAQGFVVGAGIAGAALMGFSLIF